VSEPASPAPPAVAMEIPAQRPGILRRLYAWVLSWAETRYGTPALAALSFAESSIFPIPPDVLQIALSISKPRRSFFYAGVSAAASVLGAVVGFEIGRGLWAVLSGVFFSYVPGVTPAAFEHVQSLYRANAFLAILTAAFTPIPFKVFTIASGVFGVPLPTLLAASALGRSGRFFGVGTCIFVFGPGVKRLLDRYLEVAAALLFVLFVLGFWLIRHLHGA
jgi:membrane protein YqaA with SNARE-associated domain